MNKQEKRYIAAARKAFEIQNEIEINENAGLEPARYIKHIRLEHEDGTIKAVIEYTLADLGGCSADCMYTVVNPHDVRTVIYIFSKDGMTCDHQPIFKEPWLKKSAQLQQEFYQEYADLLYDMFKGSDKQILLPPLPENGKVTKARKDEAIYILAKMTENTITNPSDKWYSPEHDKEWQLAEIRKYGTVRICKDKASGHWIVTTYGQIEKISGYYGADINTGEMISQDAAQEFYHRSRA